MAKKKKIQIDYFPKDDDTPYGELLAQKVATYLEQGNVIAYDHKEYCGMGFAYWKEIFYYGFVEDGYYLSATQKFESKMLFVTWLATQSDNSFCEKKGEDWIRDRQGISKERLENEILEKNERNMTIFFGSGDSWETIKNWETAKP